MGGLRADSSPGAIVHAETFLKPATAVNQEDASHHHAALSPHSFFDRVLPSLDILEQAKEMLQEQQEDDDDQIAIDDDDRVDNKASVDDDQVKQQNDRDDDRIDNVDVDTVEVNESTQPEPPIELPEELPEADKDNDTENIGGPEESGVTNTPPKYGTIQDSTDGPPYLPKDIEELGGDDVALAPKQMRDPVVVPAVRSKEEEVEKEESIPSSENETLSPIVLPSPPKAGAEEGGDVSMIAMEPIQGSEPLSNKAKDAIEEVVGTEESHPGIIHVPQMSEGKDKAQNEDIGQEDQIEFEFVDGINSSVKEEEEVEVEENIAMNDDEDDSIVDQSADNVAVNDDDDHTDDDDDDDDDNTDDDDVVDDADDDDRVSTPEDKPVVESVSLDKRKPSDETKEPYLPDESDTAPCRASSSISSAVRCKTSALIRYHTVGFMFGASLILVFFYYRRKRRLGGRRSRRLDKTHEYARIIQEYDELEGTFDDDISYNDDNETMSTWSGGGLGGGLEMQNYHSDDRLGVHELNG